MQYAITRQHYWGADPDEALNVEIAAGGIDYAGPDALVGKYAGEFMVYADPREAVEAAIEIATQWQRDCPGETINMVAGYSLDMVYPANAMGIEELRAWGEKEYARLPKCSRCEDLLPDNPFINLDSHWSDEVYCSEYCADEAYWSTLELCQECEKEFERRDLQEATGLCDDCAAAQEEEEEEEE